MVKFHLNIYKQLLERLSIEIICKKKKKKNNQMIKSILSFIFIRRLYQFRLLFERSTSQLPEAVQIDDETYCPKTSVILWNAEAFEEDPPQVQYENFLRERPVLKQVLKNVAKFGICLIKGKCFISFIYFLLSHITYN